MIHVRDIRRAIGGLHDDVIVTAAFSYKSDDSAFCGYDLNLEGARLMQTPGGPQVIVEVRATSIEDDEKKESDYADKLEFNVPGPAPTFADMLVGYAKERGYNGNAMIPGAKPTVLDPRD